MAAPNLSSGRMVRAVRDVEAQTGHIDIGRRVNVAGAPHICDTRTKDISILLMALFAARRDAAMSEVATSRHKGDIVNRALMTHSC